jgi:hypothetical protein
VNGRAFNVDLVFFGLWCVLSGYPSQVDLHAAHSGVLLMIDGVGWMLFMLPPLALLFPVIAVASDSRNFRSSSGSS